MLGADEDAAVVKRVTGGDPAAFRILVERHQDVVFSLLLRLVRDRELAGELAQETFVRAFASVAGFRGRSRFRTWLIQIAVNLVRDRRRSRSGRPVVVSIEELRSRSGHRVEPADPRPAADPLDRLAAEERVACLERGLARLPAEYREVFLLKHVEGLAYEEISALTGASVGALKVRAHRARCRLREACEEPPRTRRGRSDGRRSGSLPGR